MADSEQIRVLRDMAEITKLINRIQVFFLARVASRIQSGQPIDPDMLYNLAHLRQQLNDIAANIGC